jgi:chemotaxis protein methyltransferase CheR
MTAATHLTPAAPSPEGSEFEFDAADFQRIRKLIHARAGISLHAGKQSMVYSRVSRVIRDGGYRSFGQYLQALEHASGPAGEAKWQEFVNCLTTNLTAFFREEHHFPLLHARLVANAGRSLRLWCNAASTGEEPYSLAMTVVEALGPNAPVTIVCSDIDTQVLAKAQRGVYPADARGLSPQRLRQHFLRGTGANNGLARVKPELQRLVEFRPFNLMDAHWSLGEPFDIVFCRNVMIYFDAPTQRAVLERMHRVIRPGGLMFAGHSENFSAARDLFRLRGKTVYERV